MWCRRVSLQRISVLRHLVQVVRVENGRLPNHVQSKRLEVRGPTESRGHRIPDGVSNVSNEEELKRELQDKIWKAQVSKNYAKLLQCVTSARHNRIILDVKDYSAALKACTQVTDDRNLEAYWIYGLLKKKLDPVPLSVFQNVLKVCLTRVDTAMALHVVRDCESLGNDLTELFLYDLLSCLSRGGGKSRSSDGSELLDFYDRFRKNSQNYGWQGTSTMYLDVLQHHIRMADTEHVLEVLQDMTANSFEPSLELCYSLLGVAMFHADSKILLVLATWFSEAFNVALEYGTLCRMLQIAAASGEPKLGQVAIQLMSKSGHSPRASDYAGWVRASVTGNDFVGSVEALMEAEGQGHNLCVDSEDWDGGSELAEAMAYSLSRSVRRLDDTYFALVELVRGNLPIPRMTLNAIIMAAGRMGQIDRAFATFKEYKTLFNLCPDVHAFNSLLYACASFRDTNINTLLSVLQNMEAENVAPNSYSFSIMLQTMADCEDLSSLEPVLDVVEDNNHSVRTRALRCVAVTAAKQGDSATIERIRKHCVSQEMPELKFLQSRIKSLVNSQARVQLNSLVQ